MSPAGSKPAVPEIQRPQAHFWTLLLSVSAMLKSNLHDKDLSCTYTLCACFVWFSLQSRYLPIVDEGAPSACRQCSSRAFFPVQWQGSWDRPTPVNLQWENGALQCLHLYSFPVRYSHILFRFVLLTITQNQLYDIRLS